MLAYFVEPFLVLQESNQNYQGPKPLWNMIYSYKDA